MSNIKMSFKRLNIFKVKPEERYQSIIALILIVVLNALFIYRMHDLFMQPGFGPYWKAFEHELHLSGYDPLTYLGVSNWDVVYQVYRHPLLSFMIWPLWAINEGLTWVFGINFVQYLVAALLIFCSYYSYIFLYRIHREVIELSQKDATLMTAYCFSFAYILMSVIVPDHFTISMFLLLISLYISGVCIKKGRKFLWWQSAILFYITAGVTLSNGIKVFLSGFFVNLGKFFRPKYLLLAVILPAALLWGTAIWEYRTYVLPKEKARAEQKAKKQAALEQKVAAMTPEERTKYEEKKAKRDVVLKRQAAKTGTPMENYGFLKWTDISTSRWQSTYENLFGESIQFHQDYFLEDTLVHRPVFVPYRWTLSYCIETLTVLLFVAGIWFGRKSRFLWLCLSCAAFDMFIHLILGFGINEVFIMAPHWLFVLPIATAYLLKSIRHQSLRVVITLLALYLFIYNGYLLTDFLLSPIKTVI